MTTSDISPVLQSIVSKVLKLGVTEFEVEYDDGHEQVFACNGPIGMGIAKFKGSSEEAKQLRGELYSLRRKRQKVKVDEIEYRLHVETFDSFGDMAYRVTIHKS